MTLTKSPRSVMQHPAPHDLWQEHDAGAGEIHRLARMWRMAHLPADYQPAGRLADPAYCRVDLAPAQLAELEMEIRIAIIRQLRRAQRLWTMRHGDTCPREWQADLDRWHAAGGRDLHDLIAAELWRW